MSAVKLHRTRDLAQSFFLGTGPDAIALHDERGCPTGQIIVAIPLDGFQAIHVLHCAASDWTSKVEALAPWPAVHSFCAEAKESFDAWHRAAPMECRA
jgi:hypothetical protein